ncbi:MAG: DUF4129 domain-containing protein [Microthrixaceae bacterium]
MILGDLPPDALPGRGDVAEVMSRPELQYPRSVPERIGDWVAQRLDDLFGGAPAPGAADIGGPSSAMASLVGWVLVLLAVALVIVVVVLAVRRWVPRGDEEDEEQTSLETEHRRSARDWRSDAERHESEGRWKLALKARHRELVRTLVDRAAVADVPGRTDTELARDLQRSTPGAGEAFDTASMLFELAWFAGLPTGAEENERFRRAAAEVLACEVTEPLDREPVLVPGTVVLER